MLNKLNNKPLWYKIWAVTTAISAIYFLIRYCFFEINTMDRLLEVYALTSLVIDYLLFPPKQ